MTDRALELGRDIPTCRVIVNQAHTFATGGAFTNGMPFSLSMGCGSWGGNSIDDQPALAAFHADHQDDPRNPGKRAECGRCLWGLLEGDRRMILNPESPPRAAFATGWTNAQRVAEAGFIFPDGEAPLSWADLRDSAMGIAGALTAQGVTHGESVAIMCPNGREAVECLFGVLYGGFRATMINLAAGKDAIAYALDHSDARFAFVDETQVDLFRDASDGKIERVYASTRNADTPLHPVAAKDHALLMYTSGTTGRPKGVVHTQASLLAGGWTTAVAHALTPADRGFCVLPIYHINGLVRHSDGHFGVGRITGDVRQVFGQSFLGQRGCLRSHLVFRRTDDHFSFAGSNLRTGRGNQGPFAVRALCLFRVIARCANGV